MKYWIIPMSFTTKLLLCCVLLLSLQPQLRAQVSSISGKASVLMNNNQWTKPMYEAQAYQMAINNALDKAFGSSVKSTYERVTYTEMEGRSVANYQDVRNRFLNTFPNGSWLKDHTVEYKEFKDKNGKWWMRCHVSGEARKIHNAKTKFEAQLLDGYDKFKNQSLEFKHEEQGYLYFNSPTDGYLICFYDDMKTVQRCLPYNNSQVLQFPISNNKEYFFFSADKADYGIDISSIDEIEFYTDKKLEYNQLYVIFSPTPMSSYFINPVVELNNGYSSFKSMSREYFHNWLQENRLRNTDLQVEIIGITIKRN